MGRSRLLGDLGGAAAVPALVAAVGAAAFALVHGYWLLGGGVGLPDGRSLYDSPLVPGGRAEALLLLADLVAIPASAVAVAVALGLVGSGPLRTLRPGRLVAAAAVLAGLCLAHSLPVAPDVVDLLTGRREVGDLSMLERFSVLVYEPVFFAGGVTFAVAAVCGSRRRAAVQ